MAFVNTNETNQCRVCLNNTLEANLASLFLSIDNFYDGLTGADMIMACSSVQIFKHDGYPQHICQYCRKQLLKAYEFKKQCEHSDKLLHQSNIKKGNFKIEDEPDIITDTNVISENKIDSTQINGSTIKIYALSPNPFADDESEVEEIDNKNVEINSNKTFKCKYNCKSCFLNFNTLNELNTHNNIKHTDLLEIKHSTCSEKVSDNNKDEYVNDCNINKCNRCKIEFKTLKEFLQHKCEKCVKRRPTYLCPVCGINLKSSTAYHSHIRIHTGEKPYECDICKKRFTQSSTARSHRATHSEKKFICETCGRKFYIKNALKRHCTTTHSEERRFVCDICGKKYKEKKSWKQHNIVVHSGMKNFQCQFCNKEFGFKKNLVVHLRIHTGDKPYSCKICSKTFRQSYNLTIHMKVHNKKQL